MSKDAGSVEILGTASTLLERGVNVCIATVIGSEGSNPSTPGQKLLVADDATTLGTVGGGAIETEALQHMKKLLAQGCSSPECHWYALAKDLAMACGGRVQLLFEPMLSATPVLLIGAGHIGFALAHTLPRLGFRVVLLDERPAAVHPDRLSNLDHVDVRLGAPRDVAENVALNAPVVVATHDHQLDVEGLAWAVARGHVYVGGVGSVGKAAKLRKTLLEREVAAERIDRVRMPIGLPIGGRTPEEIALSIAAELVAWRSGKLEQFT